MDRLILNDLSSLEVDINIQTVSVE